MGAWGGSPAREASCALRLSLPAGTTLSSVIPDHQLVLPCSGIEAGCSQLSHKGFLCCFQRPSSPFSQGHSNPRDGSPVLPPLGARTHPSLPNGREVARMCPSLPGTAGSPGTIPEKSENPLLPGCQKGEVSFLLWLWLHESRKEPPQETAHELLC